MANHRNILKTNILRLVFERNIIEKV